ncbi:hypothetical protein QAD02_013095 [Eretmocerus hayati]|uniref:Uncharacterized protein n=1 Tax=Eretmocerus hayati TaxID=131215 RepID=A0ACC2P2I8_9HYME|nr:hypothetical protein QAD02_013095 [Eretmocerus hayati]
MTSGCCGPIATPGPTPHMPHAGVMAAVEAFRQMCQGTPYASWANAMVPPPPMEGWTFPRLWPPAMPSPTLKSAQIHGIRDSGTETEAGARASPSEEDDARAQTAHTNTQRDRLYAFRYPQQSVPPTTVPAKKLASTELNELADNVAGLEIKGNAKESGTKPTESAAGAPAPPPASNGQKGKGRGRRGGKKNATEASQGGSAETAAVATSTRKPACIAAPKPPPPASPTPTPSMASWGLPWAFPPYPYWQMPGMPGTPGAPRNRRPADAESNAKRQE